VGYVGSSGYPSMSTDICGAEPHAVSVFSDRKAVAMFGITFTYIWKSCVEIYFVVASTIEVGLVGLPWCGRPKACGLQVAFLA
jgi:hypothetical protein